MSVTKQTWIGLGLLLLGLLLFAGIADVGSVVLLALGLFLIILGARRWQSGGKVGGGILMIVGLAMLTHFLPFLQVLIGLLFAGACLYVGWKLLTNDRNEEEPVWTGDRERSAGLQPKWEDAFEAEWNAFVKKVRPDQDDSFHK